MIHNKKFKQVLEVIIEAKHQDTCLMLSKYIKNQCDAWGFCVTYNESKSARKGPVLKRDIMIYQEAYSNDTIIFKEAIRIICLHLDLHYDNSSVKFTERGTIPIDKY